MEIRLTLGRKNLLVDFSSRERKCWRCSQRGLPDTLGSPGGPSWGHALRTWSISPWRVVRPRQDAGAEGPGLPVVDQFGDFPGMSIGEIVRSASRSDSSRGPSGPSQTSFQRSSRIAQLPSCSQKMGCFRWIGRLSTYSRSGSGWSGTSLRRGRIWLDRHRPCLGRRDARTG